MEWARTQAIEIRTIVYALTGVTVILVALLLIGYFGVSAYFMFYGENKPPLIGDDYRTLGAGIGMIIGGVWLIRKTL